MLETESARRISDDDATVAIESIEAEAGNVADILAEVGDRVTYCLIDDSSELHSVLIVNSEGSARMAIINERSGLAQPLLGLAKGEVGTLHAPG